MRHWQLIWSKLGFYFSSGITLDIDVIFLWRTSYWSIEDKTYKKMKKIPSWHVLNNLPDKNQHLMGQQELKKIYSTWRARRGVFIDFVSWKILIFCGYVEEQCCLDIICLIFFAIDPNSSKRLYNFHALGDP